jgi:hypothetical protein
VWNPVDSPVSVLRVINEKIIERHAVSNSYLPSFAGASSLVVGSDYSGEHADSNYLGFSFVILPDQSWRRWDASRLVIREHRKIGTRRMAYSKLGDALKRAALDDLMGALLAQHGLAISVIVNKRLKSLFDASGRVDPAQWAVDHCSGWKPADVEKMLRVIHVAAFFVAGVLSTGQEVRWVTDHDAIVANEARFNQMASVWKTVLNHYLTVAPRKVHCSTSFTSPLEVEDFVAIPDLIGGALVDLFTAHQRRGDVLSETSTTPYPDNLTEKATAIVEWLGSPGALRRLVYTIELGPREGTVEIADINLSRPMAGLTSR